MPLELEFENRLNGEELDLLFRRARTHNAWQHKDVPDSLLHEIYDLAKWGPTSANSSPGRFLFLKNAEQKQRLIPHLAPANQEKSRTAPVVTLIAYDTEFYDHLPALMPHTDAKSWFAGSSTLVEETAFRNSTLQGAYLMLASRALGLDCGPMSGFDAAGVNQEFFPDGKWKINFICNLGYGDRTKLFPRLPRLTFEDAALIL